MASMELILSRLDSRRAQLIDSITGEPLYAISTSFQLFSGLGHTTVTRLDAEGERDVKVGRVQWRTGVVSVNGRDISPTKLDWLTSSRKYESSDGRTFQWNFSFDSLSLTDSITELAFFGKALDDSVLDVKEEHITVVLDASLIPRSVLDEVVTTWVFMERKGRKP